MTGCRFLTGKSGGEMSLLQNTQVLTLPNGVRIYCLPRQTAAVEIQVHIATGSINEGRFLGCGLSHFLEHMTFQGCKGYPGNSIADTVSELGGDVNAYTSCNRTCYRMQLPVKHFRRGLKMLNAMVRYPQLPARRFEAEKDVILRECDRGTDDPDCRLYEHFMKQMFLTHPLRHPVIGYRNMINTVTRDMAMEYHQERYTPERCVITASGGVDPEEFFAAAAEYFSTWETSFLAEPPLPAEPFPAAARQNTFKFADPLHRIMCGVRAPEFGAPELPAVELLFSILGTGDGSTLNRKLILESQLGVSIRSGCYSWGENSFAVISGKAEPAQMPAFCDALKRELEAAASGNFSADEIEREKEQQYADRLRELRDNINLAGEIAGGVLYAGSPDAGDVYLDNLAKVDLSELQRVAGKFLNRNSWVTVTQSSENRTIIGGAEKTFRKLDVATGTGGVKLLCAADHELPLCNFFMIVPGGALHETPENRGISKLIAATLTSGSGNLSEAQILAQLDAAGVDLEISGGLNSMTLEFSAPRRRMDQAVNLLAQILHEPSFPDEAWHREQMRYVSVLKERGNRPEKLAFDIAGKMLYGDHPYAGSGFGSAETIQSVSPEQGRAFFKRCCFAPQTVIGFGGDCTPDDVSRWAKIITDAVNWCNVPPPRALPPKFAATADFAKKQLNREQTVVVRMVPGVACGAGDWMDVGDILGQAENGLSANLFKLVREKNALSYSVGMTYSMGFHPGYFAFYAMTAPGAGEKVLKLLNSELSRLGNKGLTTAEIAAAKAAAAFEAEKVFDTPESWLRTSAMDAYYGFDPVGLTRRARRIYELSETRCNELLREHFANPGGVEVIIDGAGEAE